MKTKSTCRTLKDGDKEWTTEQGVYHREDGPAIITDSGIMFWYKYGSWHKEDGPAVVYPNGTKFWYLDGRRHTEEEFLKLTQKK